VLLTYDGRMRLVFAGSPEVAVPTLRALHDAGHEIVLVITQPDARGRRGSELRPTPVRIAAEELGLEVLTPATASAPEVIDTVRAAKADAGAIVAYGQILRPALLEAVSHGWINLHFSVLPAWRGAAPVQRAIMAGDDITGASTFVLDEGMDTGPVIGVLTERIRAMDTAGTLLERLSVSGADLMVASLAAIADGSAAPVPQSHDGVSYAAKLNREDAYIRWELPAHTVDRHVRGCTPAPGAWTTLPDASAAKIGPVLPRERAEPLAPGHVRAIDGEVLVGTGTHPVALTSIQPAGRKETDAASWWRGARLLEGSILGEA
jgi:methionyl-tRNA formyltransferase